MENCKKSCAHNVPTVKCYRTTEWLTEWRTGQIQYSPIFFQSGAIINTILLQDSWHVWKLYMKMSWRLIIWISHEIITHVRFSIYPKCSKPSIGNSVVNFVFITGSRNSTVNQIFYFCYCYALILKKFLCKIQDNVTLQSCTCITCMLS